MFYSTNVRVLNGVVNRGIASADAMLKAARIQAPNAFAQSGILKSKENLCGKKPFLWAVKYMNGSSSTSNPQSESLLI